MMLSPALKSPRVDLISEALRSFLELTKKGSMRNREFSQAKYARLRRNTRRDQRLVRVPDQAEELGSSRAQAVARSGQEAPASQRPRHRTRQQARSHRVERPRSWSSI